MYSVFCYVVNLDPSFVTIWAVFFFSAAMYPLGMMLGAPCSPCCAQPCTCGDYRDLKYEEQTNSWATGGRWCCNGSKPAEITVRITSTGSQTVSFDENISNSYGPYWGLNGTSWLNYPRQTYGMNDYKRFVRRTIVFDCGTLNADYVMQRNNPYLFAPNTLKANCGYVGVGKNMWLYAGTNRDAGESETFPAYTITLENGNGVPFGNGTVTRTYYKQPCEYVGFFQYNCSGVWSADSIGGETTTNPAYFFFPAAKSQKMLSQACDLRSIPSGAISGGAETLSFMFQNILASGFYTSDASYTMPVESFAGSNVQDGKWPKCTFTAEVLPP